jgi:hypothetical protein
VAVNIEELVPLTNGLSFRCDGLTLVCDRAKVRTVKNEAIEMKFSVAGTDYVPRLRLARERIARATSEEIARIVRHVARHAVGASPQCHS